MTSPNTGYAVSLRSTHIADTTSHTQKRYMQLTSGCHRSKGGKDES